VAVIELEMIFNMELRNTGTNRFGVGAQSCAPKYEAYEKGGKKTLYMERRIAETLKDGNAKSITRGGCSFCREYIVTILQLPAFSLLRVSAMCRDDRQP
jgi:hypothetical protein